MESNEVNQVVKNNIMSILFDILNTVQNNNKTEKKKLI